jgi:hypothetical protein
MHKYEYDIKIECNQDIDSITDIFGAYLTGLHSDDFDRGYEMSDEGYIVADYYNRYNFKSMDWWKNYTIKKDSRYCVFRSEDEYLIINTKEKPTNEVIDILINRAKEFYNSWDDVQTKIHKNNRDIQVGVEIDSLEIPLEIIGLTIVEHETITTTTETVYF